MENVLLSMIIAILPVTIGFMLFVVVRPKIKEKSNNKMQLYLCDIVIWICILNYVSFLICLHFNHKVLKSDITEYPIEKLTINSVYFNSGICKSLNESYTIIEEPNEEYNNVVVVETKYYEIQWLFKIHTSGDIYHVYLSDKIYERLQNKEIIYENEK